MSSTRVLSVDINYILNIIRTTSKEAIKIHLNAPNTESDQGISLVAAYQLCPFIFKTPSIFILRVTLTYISTGTWNGQHCVVYDIFLNISVQERCDSLA